MTRTCMVLVAHQVVSAGAWDLLHADLGRVVASTAPASFIAVAGIDALLSNGGDDMPSRSWRCTTTAVVVVVNTAATVLSRLPSPEKRERMSDSAIRAVNDRMAAGVEGRASVVDLYSVSALM